MADSTDIIIATFEEEAKTYQAFSDIKHLAATREIDIEGLVIARKATDGSLETPEVITAGQRGAVVGGVVGSLVGILGGPLGVLLGWGTGALLGSIKDFTDVRSDYSLIQRLTEGMHAGDVAIIGEVDTAAVSRIRQVVTKHGGELLQRAAKDVEDEIDRANRAQKAASTEALRTFTGSNRDSSGDTPADPST
jgi:uncharacterized membrane protein